MDKVGTLVSGLGPAILPRPRLRTADRDLAQPALGERVTVLDNLRTFLILGVVFQHAAMAYNGTSWWPVVDSQLSSLASWASALADAWSMPLLFFVAGYFGLASLRKRSPGEFAAGKLKRLGSAWTISLAAICPLLPLAYHLTRSNLALPVSFADIYTAVMGRALEFDLGLITSMDNLMATNGFYQRYMWFLSLLILFFLILAVVYRARPGLFATPDRIEHSDPPTSFSEFKLWFGIGGLTALVSLTVSGAILLLGPQTAEPEPFFNLFSLIQFRPSRLPLFIVYFAVGLLACRNRWFKRGIMTSRPDIWAGGFMLSLAGFVISRELLVNLQPERAELWGPVFFTCLNFLAVSGLGFFTWSIGRFFSRPTGLSLRLGTNALYIYLAHYPLVIFFQFLLQPVPILPGWAKFLMVGCASAQGAYLLAQYLIRPHPRAAALVALGLTGGFLLLLR